MRKLVIAALALAALGGYATVPATAGTSNDPEITDPAGDANGLNGQGVVAGLEEGPDTRPASIDSADLREVWLSTDYETNKVLDPETGSIARVEYVPTALRVHLRTEAPIGVDSEPMPVNRPIRYRTSASLSGCPVGFDLLVTWSTPGPYVILSTLDESCPNGERSWYGSTPPSFEGSVASFDFSFAASTAVAQLVFEGQEIPDPAASVLYHPRSFAHESLVLDEAAPGRSFTVGSDVPADVECAEDPDHPDCRP